MSDNLKSANSAKTGIIFSDARLDQKLTIDEVSDKTLINTKFIKAIESGDYTDFPSEGFAKAYFIKYQNFLNIQCEFPSIYVQENRKDQIVKKSVAVFNRSFKKFITVLSLLLLGMNGVMGQIAAFNNTWSGTPATVNATTTAANIGTITMSRGSGITAASSTSRFSSNGFASGATLTISNDDYYTFTITANSGYAINLNSAILSISLGSSGTGPQALWPARRRLSP